MTCAEHLWWFDAPCPKCAAAVTAAVTVSLDEPELPPSERAADDLDIPPFLRRSQFRPYPPAAAKPQTTAPLAPERVAAPPDHTQWSEVMLHEQLNHPELSLVARQPIYRELQRRQDLAKTRDRIAALKAAKQKEEKQDWEK